jgi:hypothetical protein
MSANDPKQTLAKPKADINSQPSQGRASAIALSFVELRRCAAHAFVGSRPGNIEAHSAGTILSYNEPAGRELERSGTFQ